MIVTYLALAEGGKALFFKPQGGRALARAITRHERRIVRRAARWHLWPGAPPTDSSGPDQGSGERRLGSQ